MNLLIGCTFLLLFLMINLKNRDLTSPISIFLLLWGIVCCGSLLGNFYGVVPISMETGMTVFLGVISFLIGYYFNKHFSIRMRNKAVLFHQYENQNASVNLKNVVIIVALALPFITIILSAALKMLQSGYSLLNIRAAYYGLNGYDKYWSTSALFKFAQKYLVGPVTTAIVPITIAYTLRKKTNIFLIAICIYIVVANILSSGGRFILLYVLVECIVGLTLVKKQFRIDRKTKLLLIVGGIIAVYGILKLTFDRNIDSSMGQKIYEYFFCCTSLFDHYEPLIIDHTYGTASLHGFISSIKSITDYIIPLTTPYENLINGSLNVQNAVKLSPSITTNAFVTCFFYAYLDGGIIGVIFEMFLYGHICRNTYLNERKFNSDRSLAIYLLITQGLVKTIQLMPFCSTDYVLAIVFIIFMTRNKKAL